MACGTVTRPDVLVVGGGLAGLTAAAVLHADGASVRVLEGGAQVGGRIRTVMDAVTGRPLADLGPTWVWPRFQPVVAQWLARLQVRDFPQYASGDSVVEGFGPRLQRGVLPVQDGMERLEGGPGALVAALLAQLPSDCVHAGAVVSRVERGDASALLVTLRDGAEHHAERVILATPLRITAEQIELPLLNDPDRDLLLRVFRDTPTWMSTQAKAVAVYASPFWRDHGLAGRLASRIGPLAEAHDHSPHESALGALFGFVQWPPEERARDRAGLRAAIMQQLVRCFGEEASAPESLHIQDWATEPLICARHDLARPPAHPEVGPPLLRAAHADGRLLFAVSETSAVSPGLIEGALAAGERAGRDALSLMHRGVRQGETPSG